MADFVLIDGDTVTFVPAFGPANVIVQPGKIKGTGPAKLKSKKVCVAGDEKKVKVQNCAYTALDFIIPGMGTLKIEALGGDQKAQKTKSGGKLVLLVGQQFTAVFEVQSPAKKQPPAPGPLIPDPMKKYSGQGMFTTTNTVLTGS